MRNFDKIGSKKGQYPKRKAQMPKRGRYRPNRYDNFYKVRTTAPRF